MDREMPTTLQRPQQTRPNAIPRPVPRRGESQLEFVERCQRCLRGNTDSNVKYALDMWAKSGREGELNQIARHKFPAEKFKCVRNRPVFVEHSKTRKVTDPNTGQEREVTETYDREALQGMVNRCNERIADTSDFSPITAGHTPDSEAVDRGATMPDVLGYSGPYRMGIVGNKKPRYAIFCDEYHHVEDLDRLSKLQRRSPEVWMEEDMSQRFFDPIAALGAETPRLDLGLTQFGRTADGRKVEKYSSLAVSPSGSSTFLPSDGGERRRRDKHQAGDNSMLSPEDIKQIVDAIEQLDWVQGVKGLLASDMGDTATPEMGGGMPPAEMPGGMPPEAPPELAPEMAPAAGGEPAMPPLPDPEQNARYECDDDDKDMMEQYMSGDMEDEDAAEYMRGKRSRYAAAPGTAEEGEPGHATGDATAATEAITYAKSRVDYRSKYTRADKENRDLSQRVQRLEVEKREHYRRGRLSEKLADGYSFDFEDELEITGDLSDAQFDKHVERVVEKYERIPLASISPQLLVENIPPQERAKNEKYALDRKTKITKHVQRERDRGNQIEWEEAAEHIDAA